MITILCAGSRGDFQPYIALAQELQKLGKQVQITGMKDMKDFVTGYGVGYYCIEADFESLQVDEKMLKEAQSADNPLKMLLTFNKMKKYGVSIAKDYYKACVGSELVIYHPGCTIGYYAAEKLGIPSVLASPFPIHKTKEQTSVIQYGRIKSSPLKNLFSYHMLQSMLWLASSSSVKSLWKEQFSGLPKNFGKPYERHTTKNNPAVISCSNFVFERPTDWNENVHQQGYWFVQENTEYQPSEELQSFLDSGDKPIYFGFGSVFREEQKEEFIQIIQETMKRTGKRAIISGMGKIENLPPNLYAVNHLPHTWLFKQVAAVCHHGGAGTTAAGFAAGVPSIIIPFANDQHAWAHRAYDLGVGSRPISKKNLKVESLTDAIQYVLQPEIVNNAKKLGTKIASEKGAEACAKVIVDSLKDKPL